MFYVYIFESTFIKVFKQCIIHIFAHLFPDRKVFCIYFSSLRKEFGINVSNAKYTILEKASDLKIVIFPSSDKCLMRQSFITLEMLFIVLKLSVI